VPEMDTSAATACDASAIPAAKAASMSVRIVFSSLKQDPVAQATTDRVTAFGHFRELRTLGCAPPLLHFHSAVLHIADGSDSDALNAQPARPEFL
jgi:hypothetical protein